MGAQSGCWALFLAPDWAAASPLACGRALMLPFSLTACSPLSRVKNKGSASRTACWPAPCLAEGRPSSSSSRLFGTFPQTPTSCRLAQAQHAPCQGSRVPERAAALPLPGLSPVAFTKFLIESHLFFPVEPPQPSCRFQWPQRNNPSAGVGGPALAQVGLWDMVLSLKSCPRGEVAAFAFTYFFK